MCRVAVITTMTTVGYGDFTPRIPSGASSQRSRVWGILLLALVCMVFTEHLSLSTSEQRLFRVMQDREMERIGDRLSRLFHSAVRGAQLRAIQTPVRSKVHSRRRQQLWPRANLDVQEGVSTRLERRRRGRHAHSASRSCVASTSSASHGSCSTSRTKAAGYCWRVNKLAADLSSLRYAQAAQKENPG